MRRRTRPARDSGSMLAAGLAMVAVVGAVLSGCSAAPSTTSGDLVTLLADRDRVRGTAHQASLDRVAVFLRDKWGPVSLPDEPVERWVRAAEWGPTMAQCLRDAGYPGVRSADDGERLDFSGQRLDDIREYFEMDVATFVCQSRYPATAWFEDEVRSLEIPWALGYTRDVLAPCLLANGYLVPPVPDETRFAETWRTSERFDPYALIGAAADERIRAEGRCPAPETMLEAAP